jgi:phosphatidate cytidylyltransferase
VLKQRLLTALCGIILVIAAVWFDRPLPWFTLLAATWGTLAIIEFYRMTGVSNNRALTVFGIVWPLLFIIQPHLDYTKSVPVLLTAGVALSLILLIFLRQREGVFLRWAWMMGGSLYIGWLLSFFVALSRSFGKHKLAPAISPGKTWEGAAAGLGGAVIASLVISVIPLLKIDIGYPQAVILGLLISIFGQTGDLAESLLKRNTGVKDSGNLLPGHGGVLDRTDSLVFAGAAAYYFFLLVK